MMLRKLTMLVSILITVAGTTAAPVPNVLVILVDDMGYGDLQSYNPKSKIPTPHLDKLAQAGMRFTDAHAAGSVCHPSRYGLITGQLPFRVDYQGWRETPSIAEGRTTIASLLKSENYRTAMVGKWHLGFAEEGYDQPLRGGPVDRGFDTFFGIRASTDIPPYFYIDGDRALVPPNDSIGDNTTDGWTNIQGAFWREGGIASNLQLEHVLPRFADEAVGVIRDHARLAADDPLFLYVAFPAPHTPWLPSKEFQGASGASMYGDFLVMVDAMIGRVLTALDESGLANETLVIFSSDNGPVWYPTDVANYDHDSVGGLRGMKGDAYEGGHRMPFIVRWPGKVSAGSSSDQLICFTDVLATLAEVTHRQLGSGEGPDSISFLPQLLGHPARVGESRESLVLQSSRGLFSVRLGQWKYINGLGSGGFSGSGDRSAKPDRSGQQLYDLQADPGESTNLWRERPEVAKRLKAQLQQTLDEGFWDGSKTE
jgi:arylsulfatase A